MPPRHVDVCRSRPPPPRPWRLLRHRRHTFNATSRYRMPTGQPMLISHATATWTIMNNHITVSNALQPITPRHDGHTPPRHVSLSHACRQPRHCATHIRRHYNITVARHLLFRLIRPPEYHRHRFNYQFQCLPRFNNSNIRFLHLDNNNARNRAAFTVTYQFAHVTNTPGSSRPRQFN